MYSGYENPEDNGLYDIANLSSDDLKAILLEDLESTGTDRLSPDEIKLIVGILKRREERETCSEIVSKEIENNYTFSKEVNGNKERNIFLQKNYLLRFIAVLACVLLLSIVTVYAYEINIVSIFKSWTKELFQVNYSGDTESSVIFWDDSIDSAAPESCQSANEVVTTLGITQPLLPTWIPANFELSEFQTYVYSDRITVYEYYEILNSNEEFSILVNIYSQLPNNESSWYQKDGDIIEIFSSGGIEHYIMSNLGTTTAVWTIGNCECSISGSFDGDTLKNVINSIYKNK